MDASFWWYPDNVEPVLEEVSIGTRISALDEIPWRQVADARSVTGRLYRTAVGGGFRVRVIIERFSGVSDSGQALYRNLASMVTHLQRGGYVAFAADRDKAVAGVVDPSGSLRATNTLVLPDSNFADGLNTDGSVGLAALAAGDEIVLESPLPEMKRELLVVSSANPYLINLDTTAGGAVRHNYTQSPVIVRHRNFYPILYLPESQIGRELLTTDYRLSYTFDALFEVDPAALAGADTWAGALQSPLNPGGVSWDELVGNVREGDPGMIDPNAGAADRTRMGIW